MPQLTLNLPETEMELLRAEAARRRVAPEVLALDLLLSSLAPAPDGAPVPETPTASDRGTRFERIRGELSREYPDLFRKLAG